MTSSIFSQGQFNSSGGGGNWSSSGEWTLISGSDGDGVPDADDTVNIKAGHDITVDTDSEVLDVIIDVTATLAHAANDHLIVYGNYTNNGTEDGGNGTSYTSFVGDGKSLSGNGTMSAGGGYTIAGSLVFISGADLTITKDLDIDSTGASIASGGKLTMPGVKLNINGAVTFTNNGTFVSTGNQTITGTVAGSTWVQGTTGVAYLTMNSFMETGTANLSAAGNAVYIGPGGGFNIAFSTCHDLTVNGGSSFSLSLGSDLTVNGDFTIDAIDKDFNLNGFDLYVKGDFADNGTAGGGNLTMGTQTLILNGSGAQALTSNSDLYALTINKSGGEVTLGGAITVTNTLTLTQGVVNTTAANLLTLNDNATSSSGDATTYVDGPIKKIGDDAFIFPTGNGNYWRRVSITAPGSATDAFTAQYFGSAHGDVASLTGNINNVSSGEYWTVDRTTGSSNVNVKLYWEDATASDITSYTSDLIVCRYNGADWDSAGQSAITGASPGNLTSTLVSTFSPFTFGSLAGTNGLSTSLPIELLSFNATPNKGQVDIEWKTATEVNNDFFTVERSKNAEHFEEVARVTGAGTVNHMMHYNAIDESPYEGISYYRLKQTDFDGTITYSDLVAVEFDKNRLAMMLVFPNPVNSGQSINIRLEAFEANEEVLVILSDITGKTLYAKVIITDGKGALLTAVDPHHKIPAGIYTVIGSSDDQIHSKRLIVR